jgi:nicotinamidase-related amidase
MSRSTALLLIDMLAGAFGAEPPRTCEGGSVLASAARLLGRARAAGALVVHVVETFDEAKVPPGSPVWNAYQIHKDVAPQEGEIVSPQQRYDAFCGNDLDVKLRAAGIDTVVIAGLSSPWCVDTAVRRAFGLGYRVILAADGHGCSDSETLRAEGIARHHNEILGACFAEVRPGDEIVF